MSYSNKDEYKPVKDVKALESLISKSSANKETIISDFIQEKHLEYLDAIIESSGKFWFKKDNQLRWEYTQPFEYIIVINDGKFIISDEGDVSEYDTKSNKVFKKINDLIINSVNGGLLAGDEFDITAFENSTTYLIKLIPKNSEMKNVLSNIEMTFNKSNLSVIQVVMIESEQDFTIMKFTNNRFNEKISDDIFTIK